MNDIIEYNGRYKRSIEILRSSDVPLTKREIENQAKISRFNNKRWNIFLSKYNDEIYIDNTNNNVRILKTSDAFGFEYSKDFIRLDSYRKQSLEEKLQFSGHYSKFQPCKVMNKNQRLNGVRSFKNPKSTFEKLTSDNMIETAVKGFLNALKTNGNKFEIESIEQIDSIIILPSQFSANNRIAEYFKQNFTNKVYENVFEKRLCNDILYYKWWIKMEEQKNMAFVMEQIENSKKAHLNELFEVKKFGANIRRYLYNLLKFSIDLHSVIDMIENKNVLLVDDTIGEGTTLRDAMRLLEKFNPKNIMSFTVMRDFCR